MARDLSGCVSRDQVHVRVPDSPADHADADARARQPRPHPPRDPPNKGPEALVSHLVEVKHRVDHHRRADDDVPAGDRPLGQKRDVVRISLDDLNGSAPADDVLKRLAQLPPANARANKAASVTGALQVPRRQT